ncbi:serine/threonine-protein kinase [Spirillospora sp. NPDC047279]|uniref:serine/threonine-protein kinase n=1 Tax=Spirillospora sp. NPDC047279 TaxID=3155478 RepID=UPI0033C009BC
MSSVETGPQRSPGERVGRYRLVRILGEGGMGTVHLAVDEHGRRVALKLIKREQARRADYRERFRREVLAAREVRPFCTAPVLDAQLDGEPLYVVTEYIQGPTLGHVVNQYGPLTDSDLEGLAVGVATALAAIHGAGVVHRDLKPDNILLSPFGPRVIDFGIARRLETDRPMTQTGDTMGTPSFMAPEGLVGEPITPAADVFAWGCVVAFAGTGRDPFMGQNVGEVLYKTVYGEPDFTGLDGRLRGLVERATAKDAAARPTSAELLRELTGHSDAGEVAPSVGRIGGTLPDVPTAPTPRGPSDGRTRLLRAGKGRLVRTAAVAGALAVAAAAAVLAVALWPQGGGTVLTDDFSDPSSGWKTGSGNNEYERYEGGAFVISQYGPGFHQVQEAPATKPPDDVKVTVTARVGSDNPADEAGVFCRGSGQRRYDVLLRHDGLVRVRKGDATSGRELAKSAAPVARGAAPSARISAVCTASGDGVRIEAWANDVKVAEVTDRADPLPAGTVGIVAGREGRSPYQPRTLAGFDDFSVARA